MAKKSKFERHFQSGGNKVLISAKTVFYTKYFVNVHVTFK